MSLNAAKEFFSCLALRHTPGLGPRSWKSVLSGYDSAFEAVSDARNWPSKKLLPKNRTEAFLAEPWRPGAEAEYRAARNFGARVITWFDPKFPKRLREIPDPPALLYVQGDVSLLRNPSVAVVGARECTLLGLQSVERISSQLSRFGITVVSGLAAGIDRQAHLAGLSGIGSSIAVLGAGLDVHYPPENEDVRQALENHGLVVSEFGPGTRPEARNFPYRNRIISGLSLGVLVAEAAARSGSLITARLATEQGREVFALPGPLGQPTFAGCHRLIKQGAALVENAEDIVRTLRFQFSAELASVPKSLPEQSPSALARSVGISSAPAKSAMATAYPRPTSAPPATPPIPKALPENLTDDEKVLLSSLSAESKAHIDSLIQSLGWESHVVSRKLLVLEMQGLVRQWPGMYYSLS